MRSLIDLAARGAEQSGDWTKALRLSEVLLAREAAQDDDRLVHASLAFRNGDAGQAVLEFLALARDVRRPRTPRRRAYRGAAEILQERHDYGELESVTDEWIRFAPEDTDAGWLRLFSLVRQSLVERALERWHERELPVKTEQQALLLAQIFSLAAPPREAVAESLAYWIGSSARNGSNSLLSTPACASRAPNSTSLLRLGCGKPFRSSRTASRTRRSCERSASTRTTPRRALRKSFASSRATARACCATSRGV